jgi:hypothetical protein
VGSTEWKQSNALHAKRPDSANAIHGLESAFKASASLHMAKVAPARLQPWAWLHNKSSKAQHMLHSAVFVTSIAAVCLCTCLFGAGWQINHRHVIVGLVNNSHPVLCACGRLAGCSFQAFFFMYALLSICNVECQLHCLSGRNWQQWLQRQSHLLMAAAGGGSSRSKPLRSPSSDDLPHPANRSGPSSMQEVNHTELLNCSVASKQ